MDQRHSPDGPQDTPAAAPAGEDPLPPGMARRTDGRTCRVLATIGATRPAGDPEGMGADTWRPWP